MADWTDDATLIASLAAGKAYTDEKAQAQVENPVAIAEGATGAPVLSTGWHPYDMTNVGDGNDGLFYDFAVSGAVSSITTPTFADGYDYFIRWVGLSCSSAQPLRIGGAAVTASALASSSFTGFAEIIAPTLTDFPKIARVHVRETAGSTSVAPASAAAASPFAGQVQFSSMASGLTSVTIDFASGNVDGGQAYLYRRRNFMFG